MWGVIARLYFGVAVLIGGILGLSLGNAVFVDQMVADNQQSMEQDVHAIADELRHLREEIRALRAELARGDP
jgi:voltage-gated sodium channel